MIHKLDLKDRKLLYELDLNARETTSKLAKKVGLSQQAVSFRIKNLSDRGVARQFYTVIDAAKLGYTFYKIYFRLQNISPEREGIIIDFLVGHKNIAWVGTCDGAWDLSISVLAQSTEELEKIIEEIISRFVKNISIKNILIVSQIPHLTKSYILGIDRQAEKETSIVGVVSEKVKVDETDQKILKILSANARISSPELAQKTGLTIDVVRYRVNRMKEDKIIQSFRVWIDLDMIGYKFYKVLVNLQNNDEENLKKLINFCKSNKNIVYVLKTLGSWDLEIEVEVKDVKEFHDFMIHFRNIFQNIIKEYQALMIFREHKLNYCPF